MLISQRYNEVKAGTFSEHSFLEEARRDVRLAKYATGHTTFDELVNIMKAKSYIFEEEQAPAKKFSMNTWLKESLNDEMNEPKGTVNADAVSPFEFEKGWRYEIKLIGKYEDEDISKAKAKAVKNLEKDEIYYTKLEMDGMFPSDKGHKDLDVSKGQNLTDPDNQAKPVKSTPTADTESQAYADKMYDQGKAPKSKDVKKKSSLNEGVEMDAEAFEEEYGTPEVLKIMADNDDLGFDTPGEALWAILEDKDFRESFDIQDFNEGNKLSTWRRDTLKKIKDKGGVWEASALDDLVHSHQNDKNPLVSEEESPTNKLPGGEGDNISTADVDQEELSLGLSIEAEHTDDPEIAKEIALDHLSEDPHYYTKLKQSGLEEKVDKVPSEVSYPFYVIQYGNKLVAGFNSDEEARKWSVAPDNRGKQMAVVSAEELVKMPEFARRGGKLKDTLKDPNNWNRTGTNGFMWEPVANKKEEQLKEVIRKIVRAKLLEYSNVVPKAGGIDVDRANLKRELQNIDWPAEGTPDKQALNYPNTGYKDTINQERVDRIKGIVDRLGQEGIDLYNEYAPAGCKWGEKDSIFEVDVEQEKSINQQEVNDLKDLDPKDLAKMVLNKEFPKGSVKYKAAAQLLAAALKDKDPEVKKAFLSIGNEYKK